MTERSPNHRAALRGTASGPPSKRACPMPDAGHARNAKARAAEERTRGNPSPAEKDQIGRKADTILAPKKSPG